MIVNKWHCAAFLLIFLTASIDVKPNCKGLPPSTSMMTVTEQYKLRTGTNTKHMIQRISTVKRYKPGPFETLKENSEPDEPTVNHCNVSILYIRYLSAQVFFFLNKMFIKINLNT